MLKQPQQNAKCEDDFDIFVKTNDLEPEQNVDSLLDEFNNLKVETSV
jgi:hypothetical protein